MLVAVFFLCVWCPLWKGSILQSFAWFCELFYVSQALKMPYFSNKPGPTPGHLLPRLSTEPGVIQEPDLKIGAKRKRDLEEGGMYVAFGPLTLSHTCASVLPNIQL